MEDFAAVAIESLIELSARMDWLTKMQLRSNHPALGKHLGSEEAFVEATVAAHLMKMLNFKSLKPKDAPEASSSSDDIVGDVGN